MLAQLLAAAGTATLQALAAGGAPADEDEIIVTGERVARTVKETASSVHVINAAELETRPVDRVDQLLASIPNVQLGNGSQGPAIRGLDTTGALQALPAFLGGNRPRTTLIVDGRPATYNEFVFGAAPLWDVERVEVFRSPQTTTQGQNSIAGAIMVYTADPAFDEEYRARAITGDFHTRQISALASQPIAGDLLAVRIAGDLRYSRTTSKIADRAVGADPNHDVYGTVRAKVLVTPVSLPNSRFQLTYSHVESQAPQIVGVSQPFRERRDQNGFYGTFRIKSDFLTARASHDQGGLSSNLVVSLGKSLSKRLAPAGFGQSRNVAHDWSSEAVFNWVPDEALRLTVGVSHRHVALKQMIDLSLLAGIPHFRDWQEGTGIFGEASYEFVAGARLTVGLRYQRDRQKRIGAFETPSEAINLDYDRSFEAGLPKVSLAFDLTSDVTFGAMVQRAYNPGGTTLRFDIAQPDNFGAERLWSYESFLRARLAGGRLTLNANAFYYDIRDAQRSRDIFIRAPNGRFAGFADLFNVPRARSYGMEAEMQWHPRHRLKVGLGLGLLRSRIVETSSDYPEFAGKEFDRSPHLTASASVDWHVTARLRLSAQARQHSPYWSDPLATPDSRVGAAVLIDSRAEYRFDRFSLFGYARNLFDEFAVVSQSAFSATLEDPRQIGIGVETRF